MRLTQKNEFFEYVLPCHNVVGDNQATEISLGETEYTCKKYIIGEAIKKLGELEDVLEEFELASAEDLRNHLNFQDNMAIWEGELNYKNKIADLQHRLEVAEKALELACEELMSDLEFDSELDKHYNLQANIEYFKTKAKEMLENE